MSPSQLALNSLCVVVFVAGMPWTEYFLPEALARWSPAALCCSAPFQLLVSSGSECFLFPTSCESDGAQGNPGQAAAETSCAARCVSLLRACSGHNPVPRSRGDGPAGAATPCSASRPPLGTRDSAERQLPPCNYLQRGASPQRLASRFSGSSGHRGLSGS